MKRINLGSQMTVNQRIKILITQLSLTQAEFSIITKIKPATLSKAIKNPESNVRVDFIQKILINFPTLNARWLILGEGETWEGKPPEGHILEDGSASYFSEKDLLRQELDQCREARNSLEREIKDKKLIIELLQKKQV